MTIKIENTDKGFAGRFTDRYRMPCAIHESSFFPDEPCVLIGFYDPANGPRSKARMTLTQDIVGDLVPLLERFRLTGSLSPDAVPSSQGTIVDTMYDGYTALSIAMEHHIYDAQNGEKPDANCTFERARRALFNAMDEARKDGSFTYLEVEAALCVWECINEWTLNDTCKQEDWALLRDGVGSAELRHQSIALGRWCLAIFDVCTKDDENFFDGVSYDWEVIPLILGFARNDDGPVIYEGTLPPIIHTAALVRDAHRRNEWFTEARGEAAKQWSYAALMSDHEERAGEAYDRGEKPADFVKWIGEKYNLTPQD